MPKKHALAGLGREAVAIIHAGTYTAPSGTVVRLAEEIRRAVDGTRTYPPDGGPRPVLPTDHELAVAVANETTLAAARRLIGDGLRPAALNFASAKHPGGGFLGGARAQEESLCRSSALYACINHNPMYDYHRRQSDAMYSEYAIYSPDVPVFRDDDGTLLEQPYLCAFITCPAVNAGALRTGRGAVREDIHSAMRSRVRKVLAVAASHGHAALVLGAWGCGVFRNDPAEVAGLFRDSLVGEFRGAFRRVVFAITDWSEEQRFIGPFQQAFRG